jgi:hypothetical protein
MLAQKLMAAMAGGAEELFVDDVFSTFLYTGNGSTQTITNGIDLAGKGGMVWLKGRSHARTHNLFDSSRTGMLQTNMTSAESTGYVPTYFNTTSSGFFIGQGNDYNNSAETYASWTFRRAPKFFDVVTYTGNGVAGRQIAHSLGVAPGMVIVKLSAQGSGDLSAGDWCVYNRGIPNDALLLNSTAASQSGQYFFGNDSSPVAPTASVLTIGSIGNVNRTGCQYVAYLFAHDTSPEGIIQCGAFATDGSGNATVNLGWEPQFLITKASGGTEKWLMQDSARGFAVSASGRMALSPNNSDAELVRDTDASFIRPSATGFSTKGSQVIADTAYIYLAIRRPNKPPTTGTQVYNAIARTGTGGTVSVNVGFAPDLAICKSKNFTNVAFNWCDSSRGANRMLYSATTGAEATTSNMLTAFGSTGVTLGSDPSTGEWNATDFLYSNHFFKRAPGVMDVVCYTGTGSATTVAHSLGVAPELMIFKNRTTGLSGLWMVYAAPLGNTKYLALHLTWSENTGATVWNSTTPTSSVFSIGTQGDVNNSSTSFVAYLFATKAGISKVGSYTGNGSSQTINCGFSTGARFVLIKRTDSTGDWYVWDTARGIVAGNDPHLSLNTTAAEVTTNDSIDPDSTGFIVNQLAATNINVNGASYIYLAYA